MEQEGDHGGRIFSGSEPTDQPLVHRTEFWRGTGGDRLPQLVARVAAEAGAVTDPARNPPDRSGRPAPPPAPRSRALPRRRPALASPGRRRRAAGPPGPSAPSD